MLPARSPAATGWRPALVATDLDGTLLGADGLVSPANVEALAAVSAAGVPYVLVTGRPWRWMAPVLEQLPATGSAILANGALLVDLADGRVREAHLLGPAEARDAVVALRSAVPGCVFALEYAEEPAFGFEEDYQPRWTPERFRTGPAEQLCDRPVAKLLCRNALHDADSLHELASAALVGHPLTLTHSSGSAGLLEIGAAGVDKGAALARLTHRMGLAAQDVLAFGDGRNDLPMLAWAGHGVAVANAHPATRAVADEVAGSHDRDAVAGVLARWFG